MFLVPPLFPLQGPDISLQQSTIIGTTQIYITLNKHQQY